MPVTATKLNKENFISQVVRYGFFAEQIPECFSSAKLSNKLDEIMPFVSLKAKAKDATTSPTTLSTYKNDISRRVLSLPNPEAFLRVVKLIADNWSEIKAATDSSNSLSPITYIHTYREGDSEMLNSENVRESIRSKSDFIEGIKNCIIASLGYKYRLDVDVANCYNTIYTHSIAWAMCGKDDAKLYHRTKTPISLKGKYELADQLDTYVRYQKNNETNGIVVGPFTSRIISEVIMAELDRKLTEKGYHFRRYVDDFKFYFRTESQAQESLPIIEKVLNEYNLNLNTAKTEIHKYPFDVISQMKTAFEDALKKEGVFGVLNTAAQFQISGEKGAYKYALKMLKNCEIPIDDFDIIMPSLINVMLIDPKYGKYVIGYLKHNIKKLDKAKLSQIMNQELESSLKTELQQESLIFIQIIKELNLNLAANNLINLLKTGDDFSIIIALDIWKNRNRSVNRTPAEARRINAEIKSLATRLNGETMKGSRWLLLHEIAMHQLIDGSIMPLIATDPFFTELTRHNISFYKGIKKK
ncbi:MAG: hypothetical protein AWM53_00871 [Candidatus Dichloromethanomonas elyunquensis]|nr:MAG: hypothetical protein AWM53_00871 [Candidatus Dichloromethanomonas elyunquensis]